MDPLEAFMAGINQTAEAQRAEAKRKQDSINNSSSSSGVTADDVDPLEAFMAGVNAELKSGGGGGQRKRMKGDFVPERMDEDDGFDEMEAQLAALRESGGRLSADATEKEMRRAEKHAERSAHGATRTKRGSNAPLFDEDGNPIAPADLKEVPTLPPLDHSKIVYEPFQRAFYTPVPAVTQQSEAEVEQFRQRHTIQISGGGADRSGSRIRPVSAFAQCGFDALMRARIKAVGYTAPTPIQCQVLPVILSGHDVIGIAKTGSGKTLAFVWPMIVHCMAQRELAAGEGPIAVILSPTRELCEQIWREAKRFGKVFGLTSVAVFGGAAKWAQVKSVKAGAEVVVATPGRLIDLLRAKACNLQRTTFLVLDEADQMFSMGFEPQIRSIVGQIRPDRQTLLFSATFKKRVETLARDILRNPVRITVGTLGQSNESVRQVVHVLRNKDSKIDWLRQNLGGLVDAGKVLIFANTIAACEELVKELEASFRGQNMPLLTLHGDKQQVTRAGILKKYKDGTRHTLIATDVASRGLDISDIATVINFDCAKNIDTHVHRCGRTGRLNKKSGSAAAGLAHTLLLPREKDFAAQLVDNFEKSQQVVPPELLHVARGSSFFRPSRGGVGQAPKSRWGSPVTSSAGRAGGGSSFGGRGRGAGGVTNVRGWIKAGRGSANRFGGAASRGGITFRASSTSTGSGIGSNAAASNAAFSGNSSGANAGGFAAALARQQAQIRQMQQFNYGGARK